MFRHSNITCVQCTCRHGRENLFQFLMTKNKKKSLWRTHEHFSRGERCLHCAWHFRLYGTSKGCLFIRATEMHSVGISLYGTKVGIAVGLRNSGIG